MYLQDVACAAASSKVAAVPGHMKCWTACKISVSACSARTRSKAGEYNRQPKTSAGIRAELRCYRAGKVNTHFKTSVTNACFLCNRDAQSAVVIKQREVSNYPTACAACVVATLVAGTCATVHAEHPYLAIIDTVKSKGCDFIVVALCGRRGVAANHHRGRNTLKVLVHSRIAVLVHR